MADDAERDTFQVTLVLNWAALVLIGIYSLAASYDWLSTAYLRLCGWSTLVIGALTGIVHVALWLCDEAPRPRLFYREASDLPDRVQQRHQ